MCKRQIRAGQSLVGSVTLQNTGDVTSDEVRVQHRCRDG